ncbi:L-Ala-D/L-Glu epimerase [Klebsiella pneumoniae]|nr:L-Ala-D/L-Glu epimerase [Klebsiella pneumoniae]
MTATVEQIESWIVDVPTIRPHKLSMTTMGCQSLVIVRLTRSDGICGIGEATTIGGLSYGVESPEAISSAITHYLTPLLKGQPADNLNALTARMNGAIKGNTLCEVRHRNRAARRSGQSLRSADISPARRRAANGVAGAVDLSQRRYRERYR